LSFLPGFKFTGKMVKIMEFTGKLGKQLRGENIDE
jgi:hypothetical protein